METKSELIEGLKSIKRMLKKQAENGLYENIISEVGDEEYKKRAKKNNLASELYKADMKVLEGAIEFIESMV